MSSTGGLRKTFVGVTGPRAPTAEAGAEAEAEAEAEGALNNLMKSFLAELLHA